MASHITAVLLAGGESTRFAPFTEKNTFLFLGKPLLSWHYEQLHHVGVTNVIVVTNEKNSALLQSVPVSKNIHVLYVTQKHPGQVHAVLALESVCIHDPILLLNASDYYDDACVKAFVQMIEQKEKRILLGAVKTTSYFPGGYLKLDAKGNVTEIVEKPKKGTEPSDVVRILLDSVPDAAAFISAAKKEQQNEGSGYENALNALIARGVKATATIVGRAQWQPVKYPWNVLDVETQLLSKLEGKNIDKSVDIKSNVVIEGPVVIEEGVKIFEGTKIVGPVFIGKHTIIGNNNMIRSSSIGSDCVTGFNTDITRSRIGNNCWFHTNYIGDSVIGDNVSMGSGTVVANLRLDDGEITSVVKEEKVSTGRNKLGALIGDNVRIGVNTSTMPGIKIGSDSFISAGIVVTNDIPNGSFVRPVGVGFTIKQNKQAASSSRENFRKAI